MEQLEISVWNNRCKGDTGLTGTNGARGILEQTGQPVEMEATEVQGQLVLLVLQLMKYGFLKEIQVVKLTLLLP
jgi:hypothetical protein